MQMNHSKAESYPVRDCPRPSSRLVLSNKTKPQILPHNLPNEINNNLAPVYFTTMVDPFIHFIFQTGIEYRFIVIIIIRWTAKQIKESLVSARLYTTLLRSPRAANYFEISFKSEKNSENAVLHFLSLKI